MKALLCLMIRDVRWRVRCYIAYPGCGFLEEDWLTVHDYPVGFGEGSPDFCFLNSFQQSFSGLFNEFGFF